MAVGRKRSAAASDRETPFAPKREPTSGAGTKGSEAEIRVAPLYLEFAITKLDADRRYARKK
jgi:hypothetical protein